MMFHEAYIIRKDVALLRNAGKGYCIGDSD